MLTCVLNLPSFSFESLSNTALFGTAFLAGGGAGAGATASFAAAAGFALSFLPYDMEFFG